MESTKKDLAKALLLHNLTEAKQYLWLVPVELENEIRDSIDHLLTKIREH